jgi:hypothetical protein
MVRNSFQLIAAFTLFAIGRICVFADDPCLNFGENIVVFNNIETLLQNTRPVKDSLDLNGDGVNDRVVLLSVSTKSKPSPDIVVSNPFPRKDVHERDANLSDEPHLAIGVIHSATKTSPCKRFILYNNAVFRAWNGDSKALYKLDEDSCFLIELFPSFKIYAAIGIWTPDSYGDMIFWDGKKYEAEDISE